jgi:chemotaxis signal transduction protein
MLNRTETFTRTAILTFSIGEQRYALLIEDVIEVAPMVEVMKVAEARLELLGMVNRHGTVLPLLDLRLILGLPAASIDMTTLFIVATDGEHPLGLVVDEIHQVEYIDSSQLSETTATGKFIRGIISNKAELVQIIDPTPLLATYLSGLPTG